MAAINIPVPTGLTNLEKNKSKWETTYQRIDRVRLKLRSKSVDLFSLRYQISCITHLSIKSSRVRAMSINAKFWLWITIASLSIIKTSRCGVMTEGKRCLTSISIIWGLNVKRSKRKCKYDVVCFFDYFNDNGLALFLYSSSCAYVGILLPQFSFFFQTDTHPNLSVGDSIFCYGQHENSCRFWASKRVLERSRCEKSAEKGPVIMQCDVKNCGGDFYRVANLSLFCTRSSHQTTPSPVPASEQLDYNLHVTKGTTAKWLMSRCNQHGTETHSGGKPWKHPVNKLYML